VAAAHGQGIAGHGGGVGADKAVETQLVAQKALHQLRAEGTGHNVLISDARVEAPRPGGLHDVAHHDRQGSGLDAGLIRRAIGSHPRVAVHIVDGGD